MLYEVITKDQNSDNDLLSDREEGDADCDLDGIPNFLDTYDDCFDYNEVPEVFTPNGDGINDYFIIPGIDTEELKQNILVVYNRWGGEIYNKTNYVITSYSIHYTKLYEIN